MKNQGAGVGFSISNELLEAQARAPVTWSSPLRPRWEDSMSQQVGGYMEKVISL